MLLLLREYNGEQFYQFQYTIIGKDDQLFAPIQILMLDPTQTARA